tara:strand:- start:1658 stop:2092 length:435 start_codon:yes stop_codon:yes gene_type:complete
MIPRIDLARLSAGDADARRDMHSAATEIWSAAVHATAVEGCVCVRLLAAITTDACAVAMQVLRSVAQPIDAPRDVFVAAFDAPMALLRGSYYPAPWAGAMGFGIVTHSDYGCLTLLATDGSPGMEVRKRGGSWTGRADFGAVVL